jgi:hypothetical protein
VGTKPGLDPVVASRNYYRSRGKSCQLSCAKAERTTHVDQLVVNSRSPD